MYNVFSKVLNMNKFSKVKLNEDYIQSQTIAEGILFPHRVFNWIGVVHYLTICKHSVFSG